MQKKRTANFREDETKLLIQLWGSPEIQSQLNASHRKAPIMLQIAAAMQHHGFYRTPEEITTRIRNLKCIYHRIKKAQHMGVFGPETADWNHFPAIDAILGDSFPASVENRGDQYSGNVKKEPNDSETADSMYNGNSVCSDLEDDDNDSGAISPMPSPPLQRFTVSTTHMLHPNAFLACSTLNKQQEQNSGVINYSIHSKRVHEDQHDDSVTTKRRLQNSQQDNDVSSLLRQLLDVEKEHLELEKQRLELDRQVGSQLLTLVPLVSNILQKQQQNRTRSPAGSSACCSTKTNDLVSKLVQTIPRSQTEMPNKEPLHVSDIYKIENSDP